MEMRKKLFRVIIPKPRITAGFATRNGIVCKQAPYLDFMGGKPEEWALGYCETCGWLIEEIKDEVALDDDGP